MKDYRLDLVPWYNPVTDKVQCLFCGKWRESINWQHVRTHGFENVSEYKNNYGILPYTPIRSKRLLMVYSENAKKLRARGLFTTYKKGCPAPKSALKKGDKSRAWVKNNQEYKALHKKYMYKPTPPIIKKFIAQMKKANIGRPLSKEHKEKLRSTSVIGARMRGKTWEKIYGKEKTKQMSRKMVESRMINKEKWVRNLSTALKNFHIKKREAAGSKQCHKT